MDRNFSSSGMRFPTGGRHRVILFGRSSVCPIPAAVFAFDSSFPAPGIRLHLEAVRDAAARVDGAQLMAFGHTDRTGSDAYNKTLSDRRAKAVVALIAQDAETLHAIAEEDHWGVRQDQAMLRGLGCNPGAIDGDTGPHTTAAVKAFQEEWNDGIFTDNGGAPDRELPTDGGLDDDTRRALREAYVRSMPRVTAPFALPAFAGCASFNPISNEDAKNRRVSIALIRAPLPHVPCREGDVSACPVDGSTPFRCSFYRDAVDETDGPPVADFFDFQWFKGSDGKAHLSALTSLPDGTSATFTVYRCEQPLPRPAPQSASGGEKPNPGRQLGTATGTIAGGVCYAEWTPPQDSDPFRHEDWFVDHDIDLYRNTEEAVPGFEVGDLPPLSELLALQAVEPPVFCIDADGKWGFSGPPGRRLANLRIKDAPDQVSGLVLRVDGTIGGFRATNGRVTSEDPIEFVGLVLDGRKAQLDGQSATPSSGDAPSNGDGASSGSGDEGASGG